MKKKNTPEENLEPEMDIAKDLEQFNEKEQTLDSDKADIAKRSETSFAKSGSNTNMMIGVGIIALIGFLAYYFFFLGTKPVKQTDDFPLLNKPQTAGDIAAPTLADSNAPSADLLVLKPKKEPVVPNLEPATPIAPPPLPKIEAPVQVPVLKTQDAVSDQKQRADRMRSSIMLKSGGDSGAQASISADGKSGPPRDLVGTFKVGASAAPSTNLTKVGDMSYIIVQGKIIDSVLETPINTNYPGPIRALVSKDVYSEKGENILIPRGSRVMGTMNSSYVPGQTRIVITWNRVILPNGYDLSLANAQATDKLGMLGVEGIVDRQFLEAIGGSFLLSFINIATAKGVQNQFSVKPNSTITTTSANADSGDITNTTVMDPTQKAANEQITKMGNITQNWVNENFSVKPYVLIEQGTRLKVFVNQDLMFPKNFNDVTLK